jgi:hypothetical protein
LKIKGPESETKAHSKTEPKPAKAKNNSSEYKCNLDINSAELEQAE